MDLGLRGKNGGGRGIAGRIIMLLAEEGVSISARVVKTGNKSDYANASLSMMA